MKLFYYKHPNNITNFGDDLNPWLWGKFISDILDNNNDLIFIGIGTLLNNYTEEKISPFKCQKIVFSSGVGYGETHPKIDNTWKIYCLRGPLSAKALNVSSGFAVTDGAVLLRRVYRGSGQKRHRFSYMPHVAHAEAAGQIWKSTCGKLGFGYVDPCSPVEEVLAAIDSTEVLLTEAMHGAIAADALRIPWIPIQTGKIILPFKWMDWCASINVNYVPQRIGHLDFLSDLPWRLRKVTLARNRFVARTVARELEKIARNTKPNLSDETHLENLTIELERRLDLLRDDIRSGRIPHRK